MLEQLNKHLLYTNQHLVIFMMTQKEVIEDKINSMDISKIYQINVHKIALI